MASASVGGRDIDRHRDDRKDARPTPLTIIHVADHLGDVFGGLVSLHTKTICLRYAVRDEPCMTRLTTIAAMPASTALACGDDSIPRECPGADPASHVGRSALGPGP